MQAREDAAMRLLQQTVVKPKGRAEIHHAVMTSPNAAKKPPGVGPLHTPVTRRATRERYAVRQPSRWLPPYHRDGFCTPVPTWPTRPGACCAPSRARAQHIVTPARRVGAINGVHLPSASCGLSGENGHAVSVEAGWEVQGCGGGPWGGWSLGWSPLRGAARHRMAMQRPGRPGAARRSRRPERRRTRPQARPRGRL